MSLLHELGQDQILPPTEWWDLQAPAPSANLHRRQRIEPVSTYWLYREEGHRYEYSSG